MTVTAETFFRVPAEPVEASRIAKIGSALGKRWDEFQKQHPDRHCVRVRSMNMVVVCSTPEAAAGLAELVEEVADRHPGRIVCVVLDPDYTGPLQAWYAVKCVKNRSEQLGAELVGLHSPAEGSPLFSLINPLLLDGVPVFLWWRGQPPYRASWFNNLVEASARTIFEECPSDACQQRFARSPAEAVGHLAPILDLIGDKYHAETSFTELNWGRLRNWREMVATLFDRSDRHGLLELINRLEVESWSMGDPPAVSPQSLYLAGWLCRQLRLEVKAPLSHDREGYSCQLEGEGGDPPHAAGPKQVQLALRYRYTNAPELVGRISRVTLGGRLTKGPFRLAVTRDTADAETLHFSATGTGSAMPEHALYVPRVSHLELLGQELQGVGRDFVFEGSLRKVLEMSGALTPA